jgi:hypothetical protein
MATTSSTKTRASSDGRHPINTPLYVAGQPPSDPRQLPRYLEQEFQKIALAVKQLAAGHLDVTYVAPAKPRQGDVRYADGTEWNPGAGEGIYRYDGATWVGLG